MTSLVVNAMTSHHLESKCAVFLLVYSLSNAVQVHEDFDLDEYIKRRNLLNDDQVLTYYKDVYAGPLQAVSYAEECNRHCYIRTAPKICYYQFIIEHFTTVGGACDICTRNATNNCQCILADGVERSIISVNRQLPGPTIAVCLNDQVVIDVYNGADGTEESIHWHGILQHNTQYYDGVPFVTQCPIHKGNTFRYIWKAENPGTHFWHSHSGFHKMDGVSGAIIVRDAVDVHQRLYDYDIYMMFINDWFHESADEHFPGRLRSNQGQDPVNVLINGKGAYVDPITKVSTNTPLELFEVLRGKRYRFRVINASGSTCPVQIYIQGHKLQVIATDGESVEPVVVDSMVLLSAERYDFILYANEPVSTYWIEVKLKGLCEPQQIHQFAILKYKNAPNVAMSDPPPFVGGLPDGKVMNPLDSDCSLTNTNGICIEQLNSAYPINPELLKEVPDVKIYLPFRFIVLSPEEVFKPNTYDKFLLVLNGFYLVALVDGISHIQPPSPLLSQFKDINPKQFCNDNNLPQNCGAHCICTHLIDIPLDAVVEVVLVDEVQVPGMYHPFHLHGYTFYIMGMGRLPNTNESISLEKAIALDTEQGLRTKYRRPPGKDTIPVPNNGYVSFRFIADNPGFWYFHCHFLFHLTVGMGLVFRVGNMCDLPPIPDNFPKCGNFKPDIYSGPWK